MAEQVFNREYNEGLVHQVLTAYQAAGRQGTKAQKTRSEVSGGGAKPWRQKGTGRARAGTIRSPIWIGGGVTFAAKPRDYSQKVNKKMYKAAMQVIISELLRQDRLKVVPEITVDQPKTKDLIAKLKEFDLQQDVLIIIDGEDKNLELAARNIPNVLVCDLARINPLDLVSFNSLLITNDTFKKLEEKLS